jgi:hypothetical protein
MRSGTYAESSLLRFINGHKRTRSAKLIGGSSVGLAKLIKGREMFFVSTFLTLIFQVCLTFAVMLYSKNIPSMEKNARKYFILLFLLQLGLIIVLAFVPMHPAIKFAVFTLFAFISGVVLSIVASVKSEDVIKAALVGTITIFVMMVVFGVILSMFGVDLNWMSGILFIALLALIITRIIMIFMKTSTNVKRIIAGASLMLFAIFIVYDTNSILQRDYNGDFVTAALDYFLDILNTFVNMIQFVGGES